MTRNAERQRILVAFRKANNLCVQCGLKNNNDKIRCDVCSERKNEKQKLLGQNRNNKGLCRCGGVIDDLQFKSCSKCRSWSKNISESNRKSKNEYTYDYVRKIVSATFNHYGGYVCACCGITEPIFLTLDHINNDGFKYRKTAGKSLAWWLNRNNYPIGIVMLVKVEMVVYVRI